MTCTFHELGPSKATYCQLLDPSGIGIFKYSVSKLNRKYGPYKNIPLQDHHFRFACMKSQLLWIAPTTDLCKQYICVAKKEFKDSRCLLYLYLPKLMCHTHFAQDQFFYRFFLFWSFVSQSSKNHLILWRCYIIHLSNTLLLLFSWRYLLHSSKTCIYLFLSSWPPVLWNVRKEVLHWFMSLRMDPSINAWQRLYFSLRHKVCLSRAKISLLWAIKIQTCWGKEEMVEQFQKMVQNSWMSLTNLDL